MADSLFVFRTDSVPAPDLSHLMPHFQTHGSPPNSSSGNRNLPFVALAAVAAAGFVYTGFKYATARRSTQTAVTPPSPPSPPRRRSPSPAVAALALNVVEHANAAASTPTSADRWRRGHEIGRGSFGVVYEGVDTLSGMKVAIKEMKDVSYTADVEKEFKLLEGLRNTFVVTMYALEPDGRGGSRLILELCTGGSLLEMLQREGPIGEHRLRCYARQLLLGLGFLHRNNILHRDIKPANVLVDAQGRLKLTDFGMSRHMDSMRTRTGVAGSPVYMSPEALEGKYKRGTDLWALGATLCQLATGRIPWDHVEGRDLRNAQALMLYIGYGPKPGSPLPETGHHPHIPTTLCPQGQDFLRKIFSLDVNARGTCDELLSHPFITNGGPTITEDNYLGFLDNSTSEISLLSPLAPGHQDHVFSGHVGTLLADEDLNLTSASSPAVDSRRPRAAPYALDVTPVGSSVTRPPTATTNGTTVTTTTGTRQSSDVTSQPPTEDPQHDDREEYSGAAVTSPSSGALDSMHGGAASHVSSSSSAPTAEFLPACRADDPLPP